MSSGFLILNVGKKLETPYIDYTCVITIYKCYILW